MQINWQPPETAPMGSRILLLCRMKPKGRNRRSMPEKEMYITEGESTPYGWYDYLDRLIVGKDTKNPKTFIIGWAEL